MSLQNLLEEEANDMSPSEEELLKQAAGKSLIDLEHSWNFEENSTEQEEVPSFEEPFARSSMIPPLIGDAGPEESAYKRNKCTLI